MLVFTQEFRSELVKRYAAKHQRPLIYRVAFEDEYAALRELVELFVGRTTEVQNSGKLIAALRSSENFLATLYEVVVGDLLLKKGFNLQYEPAFGKLTPDWLVRDSQSGESFLVEVYTAGQPQRTKDFLRFANDLTKRIAKIPGRCLFSIRTRHAGVSALSEKTNKHTATKLARWIADRAVAVGDTFNAEGLSFEVCEVIPGAHHCSAFGPALADFVRKDVARDAIHEKIKKYRSVAERNKLPFVIALAATLESNFSSDTFTDLMFGPERLLLHCSEATSELKATSTPRRGGLFERHPALSAALWLEPGGESGWQIIGCRNDQASRQITKITWGRLQL